MFEALQCSFVTTALPQRAMRWIGDGLFSTVQPPSSQRVLVTISSVDIMIHARQTGVHAVGISQTFHDAWISYTVVLVIGMKPFSCMQAKTAKQCPPTKL